MTQDNFVTRTTVLWNIKWQLTQRLWNIRSDVIDNGDECCCLIVIKSITSLALYLRIVNKQWPRTYMTEVRLFHVTLFPLHVPNCFIDHFRIMKNYEMHEGGLQVGQRKILSTHPNLTFLWMLPTKESSKTFPVGHVSWCPWLTLTGHRVWSLSQTENKASRIS